MSTSSKNNKPLLVGLTGGIGSGKTTIAKVFIAMNVPVFNSDRVAKEIINSDKEVITAITNQFENVYDNNLLNAKKMADIVFNDKSALQLLNNIVHPKVAEHFNTWVQKHQSEPILIKEAAILIESGAYKQMDKIILVTAPDQLKINRVTSRDNVTVEKVKERMSKQLSDTEKLRYADYTIDNWNNQLVIPQIIKIKEQLKSPSS
ncbi:MAG: dephospho-CoA kinase [Vicingaceae bacterium]|nr:dephospho-CoA kinase [Vicingaceae bacterium]